MLDHPGGNAHVPAQIGVQPVVLVGLLAGPVRQVVAEAASEVPPARWKIQLPAPSSAGLSVDDQRAQELPSHGVPGQLCRGQADAVVHLLAGLGHGVEEADPGVVLVPRIHFELNGRSLLAGVTVAPGQCPGVVQAVS